MRLLALDTSSDACSVALSNGDTTVFQHTVEPRAHTRRLIPMIEHTLHNARMTLADLDAVVLGNGPGSFIGMRIGASVAQGIAFGTGIDIVPVSSLAAVAAEAMLGSDADRVVVAQDARMNDVYLQAFDRGAGGLPAAVADVRLHPIDTTIDPALCADAIAAGGAWSRFPEFLD